MNTIGRHLIAEFYCCDSDVLNDVGVVRRHMLAAAEIIGATVMGDSFHTFEPHGVSGAVVIAESHLSVHTWPEAGYVAVDIFTCGGLDPRGGFEHLGRELDAESCRVQEIIRGREEDLEDDLPWLPEEVIIFPRTVSLTCVEKMTPVD